MTRAGRLRRAVPGAPDELIAALAARPSAEVDLFVALARQARRDALAHEAERKRQRKQDARAHHWYDESELAARNVRMISGTGRRAARDLAALESLAAFIRHADGLMRLAVDGLRSAGYPDEEIGQALGVTRQAVGQRYGRKGEFTADGRAGGAL